MATWSGKRWWVIGLIALALLLGLAVLLSVEGKARKLFLLTLMNGLTLGALYFLVASGFTLVFGLMRNVNLAHGSLFLLGAYIGYAVADASGNWYLGVVAGFVTMALAGVLLQVLVFRHMEGQDLR